jgi:magnesium chelatase accessory protein
MRAARGWILAVSLMAAGPGPAQSQGTADPPVEAMSVHRIAFGPGDTITVSAAGRGATVVIVTGLLGGAYGFRHVTPQLVAQGMRVVIFEPLGTGTSARPRNADYSLEAQAVRLERVLEQMRVDRPILLCHSVGASICYRYALRESARVRGIIAVNGGPDEHAATAGLRRAARFTPVMRVFGGAGRARARLKEGLVEGSADPSWLTDEVLETYVAQFGEFNATLTAISGMAGAREAEPLAARLPRLDTPVRLLVSEVGGTTPAEVDVLRAIPDFQAFGVRNSGQYIQEEQPRAVVDAVTSLHRRLQAGTR